MSGNDPCTDVLEQCDYEVEYADRGTSLGVLVADNFHLQFTNGSRLSPRLVFGSVILLFFYVGCAALFILVFSSN